ncbi:hypothetical protein B0H19DRAFT_893926, partial [Mycena capillaripes]
YGAAALRSTLFLPWCQGFTISAHRTRAGIQYPRLYAGKTEIAKSSAALKFNCAQRAYLFHYIPVVYMRTVVLAIKQPLLAASALGMWVLSHVAYTVYLPGHP